MSCIRDLISMLVGEAKVRSEKMWKANLMQITNNNGEDEET